MECDALFNVLRSCCVVIVGRLCGQLSAADGALVLFCNLASGSGVELLDGRGLGCGYEELSWKHVASSNGA